MQKLKEKKCYCGKSIILRTKLNKVNNNLETFWECADKIHPVGLLYHPENTELFEKEKKRFQEFEKTGK